MEWQGVGNPLEGRKKAQKHRWVLRLPVSGDRSYSPCCLDMSRLSLPRHRSTLSLIIGNNFIRSSQASVCFLVCVDGSIIKCNTNVFCLPAPSFRIFRCALMPQGLLTPGNAALFQCG